jgi:hypothetical protein
MNKNGFSGCPKKKDNPDGKKTKEFLKGPRGAKVNQEKERRKEERQIMRRA